MPNIEKKTKFIKKWWLRFTLPDGRRWSGWICTNPKNPEDKNSFPDKIFGTFWIMENEKGFYGRFNIGEETPEDNFVISAGMKNPKFELDGIRTRESERNFIESEKYIRSFERIEKRIEDCLDLSSTYVDYC